MKQNTNPKLRRYIEENQITCVLNDTKWEHLFQSLKKIEWTLDFQRKDLDEQDPDESNWDADIYHVMGECQKIEWLYIRAQVSEHKGALLEPKITDNTPLLLEAIKHANIPYALHKDGVKIWGYLRPGVSPNWSST